MQSLEIGEFNYSAIERTTKSIRRTKHKQLFLFHSVSSISGRVATIIGVKNRRGNYNISSSVLFNS